MNNPHPKLGILELKLWESVGDAFYEFGAVHWRGLVSDVILCEASNFTPAWMPFESLASSIGACKYDAPRCLAFHLQTRM